MPRKFSNEPVMPDDFELWMDDKDILEQRSAQQHQQDYKTFVQLLSLSNNRVKHIKDGQRLASVLRKEFRSEENLFKRLGATAPRRFSLLSQKTLGVSTSDIPRPKSKQSQCSSASKQHGESQRSSTSKQHGERNVKQASSRELHQKTTTRTNGDRLKRNRSKTVLINDKGLPSDDDVQSTKYSSLNLRHGRHKRSVRNPHSSISTNPNKSCKGRTAGSMVRSKSVVPRAGVGHRATRNDGGENFEMPNYQRLLDRQRLNQVNRRLRYFPKVGKDISIALYAPTTKKQNITLPASVSSKSIVQGTAVSNDHVTNTGGSSKDSIARLAHSGSFVANTNSGESQLHHSKSNTIEVLRNLGGVYLSGEAKGSQPLKLGLGDVGAGEVLRFGTKVVLQSIAKNTYLTVGEGGALVMSNRIQKGSLFTVWNLGNPEAFGDPVQKESPVWFKVNPDAFRPQGTVFARKDRNPNSSLSQAKVQECTGYVLGCRIMMEVRQVDTELQAPDHTSSSFKDEANWKVRQWAQSQRTNQKGALTTEPAENNDMLEPTSSNLGEQEDLGTEPLAASQNGTGYNTSATGPPTFVPPNSGGAASAPANTSAVAAHVGADEFLKRSEVVPAYLADRIGDYVEDEDEYWGLNRTAAVVGRWTFRDPNEKGKSKSAELLTTKSSEHASTPSNEQHNDNHVESEKGSTEQTTSSVNFVRNMSTVMVVQEDFFLSLSDNNSGTVLRQLKFQHTSHAECEEKSGYFRILICSVPYQKKDTKKQYTDSHEHSILKARQHLSMAKRRAARTRETLQSIAKERLKFTYEANSKTFQQESTKWSNLPQYFERKWQKSLLTPLSSDED